MKECAAREDKRVIAKLKTQFESELEKFRTTTKSLEQREREILVALSTDGKGAFILLFHLVYLRACLSLNPWSLSI